MRRFTSFALLSILIPALAAVAGPTKKAPIRARQLGISFMGTPGPLNAITDVVGVGVSQLTLIERPDGDPHAVRTGITAVFPKANEKNSIVPGAFYSLNGNGEATGALWLNESGFLEGPILSTNTYSVGVVRDSVRKWASIHFPTQHGQYDDSISLPVVTETWDGWVNDINGFHITEKHVFDVLDRVPSTGPVEEGDVGGGTGSACFEFKCGIGTSSRVVTVAGKNYTIGVLVQANFGKRQDLIISGVPMAPFFADLMPLLGERLNKRDGSIVIVIATDAPLLPEQLKRVATRATLGLGRTGAVSDNSSGDLFFAFSTATPQGTDLQNWQAISNEVIVGLFRGVVPAVEESVINALVAARTMGGINGNKVYAIPHDRLMAALHIQP